MLIFSGKGDVATEAHVSGTTVIDGIEHKVDHSFEAVNAIENPKLKEHVLSLYEEVEEFLRPRDLASTDEYEITWDDEAKDFLYDGKDECEYESDEDVPKLEPEAMNLRFKSISGGENGSIIGTIVIEGITHTVECTYDAADRGMCAIIDNETHWWCGSDFPEDWDKREWEVLIQQLSDQSYGFVEEQGFDPAGDWSVELINNNFVNLKMETDEE